MNAIHASRSLSEQKRQLLESRLAGQRAGPGAERIGRRQDQGVFPLSYAQKRIWFLNQLEPGPQYNDSFHLRLTGPLDSGALRRALSEIARRHESLRARFEAVDGRPRQRILPPDEVPLPVIELDGPAAGREQRAIDLAIEESRRPFDLENGPLTRARLLRLDASNHILLQTFHHIALDGWSRAVFVEELSALYEAFAAGRPSPLPELRIQYADFAAWQRQREQGEGWKQDLAYWRKQLRGAPALMQWPADFPRPARQSQNGARHEFRLGHALSGELAALGRREGCTLFMTLLAAFQTLAFRHTSQTDVVIGCPIANRGRAELEGLIGCFLNTLALRTDLEGEPGFRGALGRASEAAMAAYAHQDVPYERLVEELNPERDPSYTPVFQTMFIFQNTPPQCRQAGGLKLAPFDVHNGTSKCDLTLCLWEAADGLAGWIEYATDLFRPGTIARLAGHYKVLLEGIVRDPGQSIARLPLLTTGETRRFSQWNETRREFPSALCVHELFERQATARPASVAVEFGGRQLSYQELELLAERVAQRLRSLGVKPGVLVGIYAGRSLEMAAAVLGVLKAGGAFVPLDPLLPAERLGMILEDSRARVMITQPNLEKTIADLAGCNLKRSPAREVLSNFAGNLVLLGLPEGASPAPREAESARPTSEDLAYVIYTSGSTGQPKGVRVCHRSVVNAIESIRGELAINDTDTWLAVTTLSFDIAVLELMLPLSAGGRVVIAPSEAVVDGAALANELERSGATVMQATPTTWRLLLAHGWAGNPRLKILCGGEAWTSELARALTGRCASLWNMYGPTETTIWSALQRVGPGDEVRIGRPLANTCFHILDWRGQPVPIGVAGELFIGGEGLAHGYLRRPELTAEKFVPDHLGGQPGARLFRTGDLARFDENGLIEFLGRADHQVKIRGHRIETTDVEAAVASHPEVRECVVVAHPDAAGENRLVAYVVCGAAISHRDWRRHLSTKLPDYMIPACFVPMAELPRTPNGKVSRLELPRPALTGTARAQAGSPMTMVEAGLASIWHEVLGVANIGPNDNFFELGGHSLMITQAIARIQRMFDVELPLHHFFASPTLAGVAASIESVRNNCGAGS